MTCFIASNVLHDVVKKYSIQDIKNGLIAFGPRSNVYEYISSMDGKFMRPHDFMQHDMIYD